MNAEQETRKQPAPGSLQLPKLPRQWDDVVVPHGSRPRRVTFSRGFKINGESFNGRKIDFKLPAGGSETWNLENEIGMHPFHIHVNPFQVTHVGRYPLATRQWRDTMIVPPGDAHGPPTATVVSRYDPLYTGDFVLHCHILPHEDQGMMARVRVEPPT